MIERNKRRYRAGDVIEWGEGLSETLLLVLDAKPHEFSRACQQLDVVVLDSVDVRFDPGEVMHGLVLDHRVWPVRAEAEDEA